MKPNPTHSSPREVQAAYDVYRHVRLNVKYYGWRLHRLQVWNTVIDIAIAVSAAATAGSLALVATGPGKAMLPAFATIAATLAVLNPILNLPKKIERCSKLWAGYMTLFSSVGHVVRDIQSHREVTHAMRRSIRDARERVAALCGDDDPCPNGRAITRFQAEVNAEIPDTSLWCPAELTSPSEAATASAAQPVGAV